MTSSPGSELRRLRALIADLDAVVWEAEAASGRFTFVSQGALDLLGYPPKLWTADPSFWPDHIHPDDRETALKEFLTSATEGRAHDFEYRFRHRDGHYVWLRDIGHVVPDHRGQPHLVRGLMVDITRQELTDERLREAEAMYRTLVEQTPVVTYLEAADGSNATLYVSPQVEAMLGYEREEFTAERPLWPELIHPDDRRRVMEASRHADETFEPYDVECRMVARDGRIVWVNDQAVLVRDEEGRPRFWQGVWVDITERKRAAELEHALEAERKEAAQLRAVDEMKNTFLQAVSHDLRTPLAAILGFAVTLEREDIQLHPDDAKDLASRIAVNARKLDRMVGDLLDLDRLGRGIIEPNLIETDIGALVLKLVAESDIVSAREVSMEVEPVLAEVDPAKVERIVENLLSNTTRHTPPGTRVWVKVRPQDDGALIAVEDEGSGVPAELRSTIFEPFRQGPEGPDRSAGVGIGLALVARFAELHGGRAWVEERDGGGASFRVWLPRRRPAP